MGDHLDVGAITDSLIADLLAEGFDIIEVGSVPPWMEKVSDLLPCGTVYRMKS